MAPASAAQQDRAEFSQVQRKLDRLRKVLENAKADAADLAAALEQADRDVAAAQAALAEAQPLPGRPGQAQAGGAGGGQGQARGPGPAGGDQPAGLCHLRQQRVSPMLTLVVDAESVSDLLDRSKLLDNVAKAANTELQNLVDAKVAADAARRRAVAAEQEAAAEEARMRERAAELEAIRAARAAAQQALERKIGSSRRARAPCRPRRAGSSARSRPRRRPAAAPSSGPARPGWPGWPGGSRQPRASWRATPTAGTWAAQHHQLQLPDPERQADLRAGGADLRRLLHRRLAALRLGAGQRPPRGAGRRDDLVEPLPGVADRQLGGRQRLGTRRQVRDLQRPHLDQGPGLARLLPSLRPCNPTLRHDDHVHISVF